MESLIPVIDKLQDVFAAVGSRENEVDLPQIVVVGSQSAGKSSVIEGIVGRDFLPRGSGIVTRRPLLIQLVHTPEGDDRRKIDGELLDGDFATFEHQKGTTYTNFEEVRKEIEAETNRGTSGKKGVSSKQISLKIYSANVVNLSLVDLPGITKVPVGDQPSNIEHLILDMITPFIENENSIILAVTPANYDFANSEALKLAREVDANGDRTLCVLTKLDLMDKGTNAMEVLQGKSIPVKLGIIGVVSRSQEDIDANKSIGACLNDEKAFLQNNYRGLASTNGIPYLAKRLSSLLHHHIQKTLPNLKDQISKLITKFHRELSTMGEPIVDQRKTFYQVINNFSSAYIATLNGCAASIESSELNGGAKICDIFYNELEKDIGGLTPMGNLSVKSVLSCIKNGSGLKPAMFIPEQSFDALIKRRMERFKEPMLDCVDRVSEELIRMIQNCGDKVQQEMKRFPLLFDHIHKIVSTMIITKTEETADFVKQLLDNELAFINTRHPEFIKSAELLKALGEDPDHALQQLRKGSGDAKSKLTNYRGNLTSHEKRDYLIIERLIDQYFHIAQNSIKDRVPKAIMNFLINYIFQHLHTELMAGLYDQTDVDKLLAETEDLAQRRKETEDMLKALNKANTVLSEIRSIKV